MYRRFGKKNEYNHARDYKGDADKGGNIKWLVIDCPANQCEQGYTHTRPDGIGNTEGNTATLKIFMIIINALWFK